jgi:hypothetical protein
LVFLGHSNRPTRQPVSKYACGMINTRKGGVILLGVLDDGRIEGFMLTKFQQDHVRLSIQDTFERYNPQLPPHLYSVYFVPVVEDDKDSSSVRKLKLLRNHATFYATVFR